MDTRLPERLLDKLMPLPWCGCWVWLGAWDTGNGYGKVSVAGRHRVVHRVVYELLVGPVPAGYVLDHLCRVRRCCNPAHLEPVTVATNTHRGQAVLFKPVERAACTSL